MPAPETNLETVKAAAIAPKLYEADFYAWTQKQAALLRNQAWDRIDLPNLITDLSKSTFPKNYP